MSTQDSGYSTGRFSSDEAATSILPPSATREGAGGKSAPAAHAGIDFGLLVLRLAIGGTVGAHGLQKVFGLAGGQGIDGFTTTLRSLGYHGPLTLLSWITGISEIVGGGLLVLGLLTPLGAAIVLAITANIVFVKFPGGYFNTGNGHGYEYELVLGASALALLFSGPGRVALDKGRRWYRFAPAWGIVGLLLAAAATVVVLVLYH